MTNRPALAKVGFVPLFFKSPLFFQFAVSTTHQFVISATSLLSPRQPPSLSSRPLLVIPCHPLCRPGHPFCHLDIPSLSSLPLSLSSRPPLFVISTAGRDLTTHYSNPTTRD
ncbi:hypothetical protein HGB07_06160 [Candidatus Roizmanbacteria bacterium]|nr:hypothetical protein [Candidatus Roizmanbacteria bacterium]